MPVPGWLGLRELKGRHALEAVLAWCWTAEGKDGGRAASREKFQKERYSDEEGLSCVAEKEARSSVDFRDSPVTFESG